MIKDLNETIKKLDAIIDLEMERFIQAEKKKKELEEEIHNHRLYQARIIKALEKCSNRLREKYPKYNTEFNYLLVLLEQEEQKEMLKADQKEMLKDERKK